MSRVTAQDFYDFCKCPHRVYLNRTGNPNERLPQHEFLNLLFERALVHEQEVIQRLPHVMPEGNMLEEQAASTVKLMEAGVERVFQGVLLLPEDGGRPDLLEKVTGKSRFGDYFYKPVDIKSGSGFEDEGREKLREDYGLQLFHYATLLERVQGFFPPEGEILNKRKERILYHLADFAELYAATLPEVRALATGAKSDEPALSSSCTFCQWWGRCEPVLVAAKDVSLLPDVGRSKKLALNGVGVRAIPEIPSFDFSAIKIKGFGPKTVESLARSAEVVLSGKPLILGKAALPDARVKVYLDFEDDPTQELIYLCGMWIEPALRDLNYHGLFCTDEIGEAKLWAEFQGLCTEIQREDYVVFHYSSYERTKISALEGKFGITEQRALGLFRSRMIDLHPIVKQTVVLPVRSYGIKHVSPFAGHAYSMAGAGGAQSIVWFQEYQEDQSKDDVLERLLTYNREDCLALKAVEGWLRKF